MKKLLIVLAIVALAPTLAASTAEASHRGYGGFSIGTSFSVGGFDFALGYQGGHYGGPYADVHYYRTAHRLPHRGYRCHGGCYEDARYTYHHVDCPLVAYHFRSHSFSPYVAFGGYFPPRYRSYGNGYGHGYSRGRGHAYGHKKKHYRQSYRYRGHHRHDYQRRSYRSDRYRSDRYRDRSRHHEYRNRDRDRRGDQRGDRSRDGARRTRPRR